MGEWAADCDSKCCEVLGNVEDMTDDEGRKDARRVSCMRQAGDQIVPRLARNVGSISAKAVA